VDGLSKVVEELFSLLLVLGTDEVVVSRLLFVSRTLRLGVSAMDLLSVDAVEARVR